MTDRKLPTTIDDAEAPPRKPSLLELCIVGMIPAAAVGGLWAAATDGDILLTACIMASIPPTLALVALLLPLCGHVARGLGDAIELATRRDLNHDGRIGHYLPAPEPQEPEKIRIVYAHAPQPAKLLHDPDQEPMDGYTQADLRWLITFICEGDRFSARDLAGQRLPSGRILASYPDDIQPFLSMMMRAGFIQNRGDKRKGQLLEHDPEVICNSFGV